MVGSLNAALLRLGMKATQGVISAMAARGLFESENKSLKQLLEKLWMHSFATACLGKRLGETLKIKNTDNIFLMGILHDIGKMLLMKAVVDIFPEACVAEPKLQRAIHEIHTTFGAVLLKKMRFSAAFIQVAEFHHWNTYPNETAPELMIIHLADFLSYEIGFGFADFESSPWASETRDGGSEAENQEEKRARISSLPTLKLLGLESDRVLALCEDTKATVKESARAF
jgi:putative nucleotidyltransferase with HDIG domain